MSARQSTRTAFRGRPRSRSVSLMVMNRNARMMEAPAPVISVKKPAPSTMSPKRMRRAAGVRPSTRVNLSKIRYIMPIWRPESASTCDAPLSRKTATVSRERPLRSPVRRALSSAGVPGSRKGSASMSARSRLTAPSAQSCTRRCRPTPGCRAFQAQKIPRRRKVASRIPRLCASGRCRSFSRRKQGRAMSIRRVQGSMELLPESIAPRMTPAVNETDSVSMPLASTIHAKIPNIFCIFAKIYRTIFK